MELARGARVLRVCDARVRVESRDFVCHRLVLANAAYFNTRFTSSFGDSEDSTIVLLDVRKPGEWEGGHAPRAMTLTLTELEARVAELDASCRTAVICGSGYRSSAATGILARAGFEQLSNVLGGTNAWVAAELPLQEFAAGGA